MAYAKSKSSYPAWVHAFVPTLVKAARAGAHDDVELAFESKERAKKARFELYGFINCLIASKSTADKEEGEVAKSWAISLRENEETGEWYLRFAQRNTKSETAAIFAAIETLEGKITQAGGSVVPPPMAAPQRPRIPTLAEKLAREADTTPLTTEQIYGTGE